MKTVQHGMLLDGKRVMDDALPELSQLSELVPEILPSAPIDPMDGKPLRYRRNADGTFLLYSVGADGKDDGGDARPQKNDSKPQLMNARDIVWPQRASPEEIEDYEKRR